MGQQVVPSHNNVGLVRHYKSILTFLAALLLFQTFQRRLLSFGGFSGAAGSGQTQDPGRRRHQLVFFILT